MKRNLFIVSNPRNQHQQDFERIAALVEELAPDIRARHLPTHRRGRGPRWASLLRPSLTVEIQRDGNFRPLRGPTASCASLGKAEEYRRLEAAGLPVPPWLEIVPDTRLDPSEWGPYVVEKPSVGGRGAGVRLRRTKGLRYRAPEAYEEDHPGRKGPMLAQRFVFTGPQPTAFRVLTCFGRVVMAQRYRNESLRVTRTAEGLEVGGTNIVAAARGTTITLTDEPDLLALGQACHAAFPDVPLVGADIMREAETGKLWVAEVNLAHVWSLSTPDGLAAQAQFGLDFYRQFDGLRRAAEGMVEATRRLAR